ncbi:MAG TPA: glutamine--fructose-6-phosphate transaminase (isomerizing) [Solirubrobacteraceae bacterium]|nr:glutamine--fructose-6-phosphate transaminase (isomerizing) [Solirubrobacteraceae bacterium]
MCGIVGYVGPREARPLLLEGLEKLEYRGYDSAGISVIAGDRIDAVRAVGNLSALKSALAQRATVTRETASSETGSFTAISLSDPVAGPGAGASEPVPPQGTGIGHTRWATHGGVTEANAHPHYDSADRIHIVLNGIVENYVALKARLVDMGARFTSETDAEVIAHLIAHHYVRGNLLEAVRATYQELDGHFSFVAMSVEEPGTLVGVRKECPLIIGRGPDETFIASAVPAFMAHTREVQYMNDDEVVVVTAAGAEFSTVAGEPLQREISVVDWDPQTAEKQGYETFMLKEIHEQAEAIADTIGERAVRTDGIDLDFEGEISIAALAGVRRIVIVACGTSYHAGLIGRYAIEEWARIPVEVEIASEYRYRHPLVGPDDLVIGISQSGETLDTLMAMRAGQENGARVLALTNIMGSQMTREADGVLYTRAGLEVSVASTKAFIAQVTAMYLLALALAEPRGTLGRDELVRLVAEIRRLPHLVTELLEAEEANITRIAEDLALAEFFLYIGRHAGVPVALEGALKLKEISYIATDAYAAGEMKHGPIALLDESTPVVAVATDSPVLAKLISNVQEVRARGARVIAVASEGNLTIGEHAHEVIRVPRTDPMLAPLLAVIPLQVLAYGIARARGLNVDQPRNLAKTVTVE